MNRRAVVSLAGLAGLTAITSASADDDTEHNKTTLQRYIDDVVNGGGLDAIPDLIASDFETGDPADAPGIDALKQRLLASKEAVRAIYDTIDYALVEMVAEGDIVMARGVVTAERDGRTLTADWFVESQFAGGKIRKSWSVVDVTAL